MPFKAFIKSKCGRHPKQCDKCQASFGVGDVYYSRFVVNRSGVSIKSHLCVSCYNKKFVD